MIAYSPMDHRVVQKKRLIKVALYYNTIRVMVSSITVESVRPGEVANNTPIGYSV